MQTPVNVTLPPNLFLCDITASFQFTAAPDLQTFSTLTFQVSSPTSIGVIMLDTTGIHGQNLGTSCTNRIVFNDFAPQIFPGSHPTNGSDGFVDTFRPQFPAGFSNLRGRRTDDPTVLGNWFFSVFQGGTTPNISGQLACWTLTIETSTRPPFAQRLERE